MLVNVAADAVDSGVAAAADVDLAMRAGVNYPRGPLEWGAAHRSCLPRGTPRAGSRQHDREHYRVSPWLRRPGRLEELR